VVDNRLPKTRQEGLNGRVSALHDTVSNERTVSTDINGGQDKFAWHLDAFSRKSDDYDIPEFILEDGDIIDTLENSDIDSQGFTLGAGWIGDDVTLSLAYGRLEQIMVYQAMLMMSMRKKAMTTKKDMKKKDTTKKWKTKKPSLHV
jgi:iron complex outermembrane receptor protein